VRPFFVDEYDKSGKCEVMFIREDKRDNGAISIRIVESVRQGDRVVQKTVRSLGQHKDAKELEIMRKAALALIVEMKNARTPILPMFDISEFHAPKKKEKLSQEIVSVCNLREENRINNGIYDIYGTLYKELGFDKLIRETRDDKKWNKTLEACVLARLAQPTSKSKAAKLIKDKFNIKLDLDHVYRMMNHVACLEDRIKEEISKQTQTLFKSKVDVLLFDVTTLYFESTERDGLRDFGFSKDCKFNNTQVVLALMTTTDGTPMGYELFPGNTSEGKTLIAVVEKVRNQHDLNSVMLVADRAMFSASNLEYMEELGVKYVVAAKLKSLKRGMQEAILNSNTFRPRKVANEMYWVSEFNLSNKQKLIVSYSSVRAKKDATDREKILSKLQKKAKSGKIKLTDLVTNQGSRKFITSTKNEAVIDENKIDKNSRWDGLHGIITNVKDKTPAELLTRYRELWKIEEAFRINKHDLRLRPIYHWKPARIKAHISICYIAFALMSYAKIKLRGKKLDISLETLREELLESQSSILKDIHSKTVFSVPSKPTDMQRVIYKAFGLVRYATPTILDKS
jgi:transposase